MHDVTIPYEVEARYLPRSRVGLLLTVVMIAVGAGAFGVLLGSDPDRAWQAYVSNWLFFTSVAMGGIIRSTKFSGVARSAA